MSSYVTYHACVFVTGEFLRHIPDEVLKEEVYQALRKNIPNDVFHIQVGDYEKYDPFNMSHRNGYVSTFGEEGVQDMTDMYIVLARGTRDPKGFTDE